MTIAHTETPVSESKTFITAVGRRKTATARVRLYKNGSGKVTTNGLEAEKYFTTVHARMMVRAATEAVGQGDKLDVEAKFTGGGQNAQADALRLGVARALCILNPTFRRALKKVGYLTRDPRAKERKKPGLKKARRAPQWAKR